jgi:hypothetical protein
MLRESSSSTPRKFCCVARPHLGAGRAVARGGDDRRTDGRDESQIRPAPRREAQFALRKNDGPVLEEQLEEAIEHRIPWSWGTGRLGAGTGRDPTARILLD